MNSIPSIAVLVLLLCGATLNAAESPEQPRVKRTYSQGEQLCKKLSLSAILGKSPWLVMGVGGAYDYLNTPEVERATLGTFSQPWAWGSILVLVLLVTFKDTILSAFSYLKLPLDALGEIMHVGGWGLGLLYLGQGLAPPVATDVAAVGGGLFAVAPELGFGQEVLLWVVLAIIHTVTWIAFNTVEVLILLNPFPYVDTGLKTARTALVGLIAGATQIHPVLGLMLVLPILLACAWVLPFAWRFLIVGWVFSSDTVFGWFGRRSTPGAAVRAFSSWSLPGVPLFTWGTVQRRGDQLEFRYRRWGIWRTSVMMNLPGAKVWSGVIAPLLAIEIGGVYLTQLRFPPRYIGKENDIAAVLGTGDPSDGSMNATLQAMVTRVRVWMFNNPRLPS